MHNENLVDNNIFLYSNQLENLCALLQGLWNTCGNTLSESQVSNMTFLISEIDRRVCSLGDFYRDAGIMMMSGKSDIYDILAQKQKLLGQRIIKAHNNRNNTSNKEVVVEFSQGQHK
ncbi:hypothetical protein P6115_003852 [Salmonella enterica]|uniref:Uncharacterized protein n=1 Tax=Salmonella enterica TaxID=28901 RepID=A0A748AST5_SALER|nr:hypothetical protein [Salmonella enterica subsp. enterica serovar Richmond]EBZ4059211.1 hypothetical protein [Salmonella enterica subsp. enterica serovar Newport]EEH0119042.1 hypothetical protein [Salmonella enterica]EKQ1970566.1 hypothetical protein [Salmonella enterica]EKQ8886547.1 hypothetical protein [Salmonella enterica]